MPSTMAALLIEPVTRAVAAVIGSDGIIAETWMPTT